MEKISEWFFSANKAPLSSLDSIPSLPIHGHTKKSSVSNRIHLTKFLQMQWNPLKAAKLKIIRHNSAPWLSLSAIREECRRGSEKVIRWSVKAVWRFRKELKGNLWTMEVKGLLVQGNIRRSWAFMSSSGIFFCAKKSTRGNHKIVSLWLKIFYELFHAFLFIEIRWIFFIFPWNKMFTPSGVKISKL